jgi:prepilin-type N-terminal cleavage/methylation domain-containing protein
MVRVRKRWVEAELMGAPMQEMPCEETTPAGAPRRGFTLIEVVLALTLLSGVVLVLSVGTTNFRKSTGDKNIRSRAQARADLQLAMARTWPTWATMDSLRLARYNGTADGLTTMTEVSTDMTGNRRIKRVTVTVRSTVSSEMPTSVVRRISVSAP